MGLKLFKVAFVFILSLLSVFSQNKLPEEITLATTDWQPYTKGFSNEKPGIVCEYVTQILAKNNIKLKILHYPWTRAIDLANQGKVNGLLTAVKSEAPNLLLTKTPIMNYSISFFMRNSSVATYKAPEVLIETQLVLGAIQDYGYGNPVDAFIQNQQNRERLKLLTGNNGIKRLIELLQHNRIDMFVGDKLVVEATLKQHSISSNSIQNIGSLAANPFYLALNPQWKFSKNVKKLLDKEFADEKNQLLLQTIINKYVSSVKLSKEENNTTKQD